MKKYVFGIASLLIASSMYASDAYKGEPNYEVVDITKILDGYEEGAYDDLLRVVDDYNRQNGIDKKYFKGRTKDIKNVKDKIDLVPVAQYAGDFNGVEVDFGSEVKGTATDIDFIPLYKVIDKKTTAIKEADAMEKTSYYRSGNSKRFYFGNGNTVNDIIIERTPEFNNTFGQIEAEKNIQYPLTGRYKRVGGKSQLDALNISIEEYQKNMEKKPREEAAKFLKEKIESQSPYRLIQKGGDLFTVVDGKEWKVYWDVKAITHYKGTWYDKPLEDKVFSDVYVFDSTEDSQSSAGSILYTKKGDIIVEDKLAYNDSLKIPVGWSKKDLDTAIEEAKENANNPPPSWGRESGIEQYFRDKKNLSDAAFKAKWVTPFENGDFERDFNAMKTGIAPLLVQKEEFDKKEKEASEKMKTIEGNPVFPSDYYKYTSSFSTPQEKQDYYNSKTPEQQRLLTEYLDAYNAKKTNSDNSYAKYEEIEDVKKQYGFAGTWSARGKWEDLKLNLNQISMKRTGKNIEFRGKGRIEGTVDLGEGDNHLTIAEQLTGKYGTNIVLGPYAKLKNISRVYVGGGVGNGQGISLSGRTSLSMDIDPTVKNGKGYLIQHALKDSDSNIKFLSTSSVLSMDSRNDFAIELFSSKISEDSIVDMGRNLNYTIEGKPTHINIITDSILHTVTEKPNLSAEGHTLLDVKIKPAIKRFSKEENEIYKSIICGKKIGILQPTITSTNKKTFFSVLDDEREMQKIKTLASYLKKRESNEIIRDVSQLNLEIEREKDILSKLETLKSSPEVTTAFEKTRQLKELQTLKEFKELNLEAKLKIIQKIDFPVILKDIQNQGSQYPKSEKDKVIAQINEVMDAFSQADEISLARLAGKYDKIQKLSKIKDKLGYAKAELDVYENGSNWKPPYETSQLKYVVDYLAEISKETNELLGYTEEKIDNELSKELEAFSFDNKKLYDEVKSYLFYTVREEEAFTELKSVLEQITDKNIYSKINKVAKNELTTYTNIPFDLNRTLSEKRRYARGGFISARNVQDNFKGNTYTAYGLYEDHFSQNERYGFMVGGTRTDHTLTHSNRSLKTVPTSSSSKGTSAYIGGYYNKNLYQELGWITGVGLQYGQYDVERHIKNNYQSIDSKGKVKVYGANAYTGVVVDYPLQEDVVVQGKGILSYSFMHQGDVSERDGLNLNIEAQNYHYVDGEIGVSLNKTLFDFGVKSNLSAGISSIFGISGYKNDDLTAKVEGGKCSFAIKGDRIKKDAVKIHIDYNVQMDTGLNYGLEGSYVTNKDESNVKFGIKAGYAF